MGRQDHNRRINAIFERLPDPGGCIFQWDEERRVLWIDITVKDKEERLVASDLMKVHGPCIAMVKINRTINGRTVIEHYTGAAVGKEHHLTTIGTPCYNLMTYALRAASASCLSNDG